ncbi:Uma2 family endonuclease [Synechococcus sp. PCC 7336]|uniref:Uma2 family endonuclease n=1 Tax=Synechococcus sp. PCC 7336 TaxID=195250 RepID=UPI0003499060|nr:Uma2 family endonuclease [Synechococcus sp. PCC 7336]
MNAPALLHRSPDRKDQRLTLNGVTWEQYETLRATLNNIPALRIAYLEGALEIFMPSPEHELAKKTIARLVELYALENAIELTACGSATFRSEAKARGLEPDECYSLGEFTHIPDIAVEVVLTSGGIDKLSVYAGLAVPEVWFWQNSQFSLYQLTADGAYSAARNSQFLPDLDFDLLARCTNLPSQIQAVKTFRAALQTQS